jgi:hypothetical protein
MTGSVRGNDSTWQNILFFKCCYNWAAFTSNYKGEKGMKGVKERKK